MANIFEVSSTVVKVKVVVVGAAHEEIDPAVVVKIRSGGAAIDEAVRAALAESGQSDSGTGGSGNFGENVFRRQHGFQADDVEAEKLPAFFRVRHVADRAVTHGDVGGAMSPLALVLGVSADHEKCDQGLAQSAVRGGGNPGADDGLGPRVERGLLFLEANVFDVREVREEIGPVGEENIA